MDLIDRYLQNVRSFLPAADQDDIIRELGEDIRAQAADREEELGRPLTPDDESALLKTFGQPILLAAKYRPSQHLISPVVFPFYWFTLKVALAVAIAVQLAVSIAMIVSGSPGGKIIGQLAAFPFNGAVTLFGWMTIAFAIIDMNVRSLTSKAATSWDPRTLKELKPGARGDRVSKAFEIVFSTIFLGWWIALPSHPFLVFGPAAAFTEMAPAWRTLHLPLAAVWLVSLAINWVLLFRPDLWTLRRAYRITASIVGLIVAFAILRADAIVTLAPGLPATGPQPEGAAAIVRVIDLGFRISAIVWVCTATWELARELMRRRGDRRSL